MDNPFLPMELTIALMYIYDVIMGGKANTSVSAGVDGAELSQDKYRREEQGCALDYSRSKFDS